MNDFLIVTSFIYYRNLIRNVRLLEVLHVLHYDEHCFYIHQRTEATDEFNAEE